MTKFIVGLTGGIGSGKTAVSDLFAQHGIAVVDADICSRTVVEKGKPALQEIHEHFGDSILDACGELNRPKLRDIIFKNPEEKRWLEQLLHPIIFEEILRQLNNATSTYAILVSPLLIEAGQDNLCNRILVVDAPESLQLNRTMLRDNNSAEQVQAIMASQSPRQNRLEKADDVIVNDGNQEELAFKVAKLHQFYLQGIQQL